MHYLDSSSDGTPVKPGWLYWAWLEEYRRQGEVLDFLLSHAKMKVSVKDGMAVYSPADEDEETAPQ